jgi:hypothetical protein
MPACPNCGRQTLRTKDWVCQWCGYPLISNAFKKIDKTFKELQEERRSGAVAAETLDDAEDGYEEAAPEPEVKPQPEKKKKGWFSKPEPRREPEKRPEPRPVYEPPPPVRRPEPPPPRPVYQPPPPAPRAYTPPPPVTPPPTRREIPPRAPEPAPLEADFDLPPEPVEAPPLRQEAPPRNEAPVQYEAPPPPKTETVEYQPYVTSLRLDDLKDGAEINIEDLDALFKSDKSGANTRLTGKTITLKGVVEKVFIREHLEIRYIIVTGRRKLAWSCRCTFEKEAAVKASRLAEGADVAVRAAYDGYGKNIIFKNCEIL